MRLDSKGRTLFPLVAEGEEVATSLKREFDWFSGVPDSMFKQVLPHIEGYHPAPRENHALAMAFGARLGGKRPCLLIQNSGLGLLGDALFGLQHLYRQGLVMVVTARGELPWEEPQHHHWGQKSLTVLDAFDVPVFDFQVLGCDSFSLAAQVAFSQEKVTAVLMHRGNVSE